MGLSAAYGTAEFDNIYFASVGWTGDNNNWSYEDGKLNINNETASTKVFMCNSLLRDFTLHTKVSFQEKDANTRAGIVFRATGISNDPERFNGYSLLLDPDGESMGLYKHNNIGSSTAKTYLAGGSLPSGTMDYDVTIITKGNQIQVYVNSAYAFSYSTSEVCDGGAVGVIAYGAHVHYDEMNFYELGSGINKIPAGYMVTY